MEKRRHIRHSADEDAFIYCNDRYGNVVDFSEGGMNIKLVENSGQLPDCWETTFYCVAKETKIENLPLIIVRKEDTKFSLLDITYQTIGVEFGSLSAYQREQIRRIIPD